MKNRIYIVKPKKSDTIKYSDLALTAGYTAYYTGNFKLQNFKEYLVDSGLGTSGGYVMEVTKGADN